MNDPHGPGSIPAGTVLFLSPFICPAIPQKIPGSGAEPQFSSPPRSPKSRNSRKVEDVALAKGGRIVKLYLMGLGIEKLTSSIGELTELKQLLVYGFRDPWKLPLLKTVDPAISKCAKLEVLA